MDLKLKATGILEMMKDHKLSRSELVMYISMMDASLNGREPSRAELARENGLAYVTATKAVEKLKKRMFIKTDKGKTKTIFGRFEDEFTVWKGY